MIVMQDYSVMMVCGIIKYTITFYEDLIFIYLSPSSGSHRLKVQCATDHSGS